MDELNKDSSESVKVKTQTVFPIKCLWWKWPSVYCSTQTATCAVTEVNESQKCCNNVALNLDECCAVNLRSRTSAWNYPRTDVSMRGLITSWEVWSHLSFLTEVTLWGKLLTAARSAVSSVMQRKSRLSDFNIFCGE